MASPDAETSDAVQSGGLGNQRDLVGRYFMEHSVIHFGIGPLALWSHVPMDLYRAHDLADYRANFVYPTETLARREKLLSVSISFETNASSEDFSPVDRSIVAATAHLDAFLADAVEPGPINLLRPIIMCERICA